MLWPSGYDSVRILECGMFATGDKLKSLKIALPAAVFQVSDIRLAQNSVD